MHEVFPGKAWQPKQKFVPGRRRRSAPSPLSASSSEAF
jgi:hypothetical protein